MPKILQIVVLGRCSAVSGLQFERQVVCTFTRRAEPMPTFFQTILIRKIGHETLL